MSAITLKQIMESDPAAFEVAGDAWIALAKGLDTATEQYIGASADLENVWSEGVDAREAQERNAELRAQVSNAEDPARRTGEALRTFGGTLRGLKNLASQLIEDAQRNGYVVDVNTGDVSTAGPIPAGTAIDAVQRGMLARANEVRSLLARAQAADDEAVRKINAERPNPASGFGSASARPLTRDDIKQWQGRSPQDVKAWWESLTPEQQEQAIRDYPEIVGWLDGVPVDDRDRANRLRLDHDQADLQRRSAELEAKLNQLMNSPNLELAAIEETRTELAKVKEQLGGLDTVERRLGELGDRGFLLGIDPAGDGKAIVAVGNPDEADNIATFVPGTGAGVNGGGFIGNLDRAQAMAEDAAEVAGGEKTSVVLWIGYDAPDNPITNSPSTSYADHAAPDLRRFQGGLRATHEAGDANQTVIGHSYGTTVIGHAASDGHSLDADQVIFVASPGVGVDQATDLSLRNGDTSGDNVYSTRAEHDIIEHSPVHGNDPTESDFGGSTFPSDPGSRWHQLDAHGSYWDDGNEARQNIAAIIVDDFGEMTGWKHTHVD